MDQNRKIRLYKRVFVLIVLFTTVSCLLYAFLFYEIIEFFSGWSIEYAHKGFPNNSDWVKYRQIEDRSVVVKRIMFFSILSISILALGSSVFLRIKGYVSGLGVTAFILINALWIAALLLVLLMSFVIPRGMIG